MVPHWELGRANWTKATYENYVENGLHASDMIYACISYIADSTARAYLKFQAIRKDGTKIPLVDHPVVKLWDKPNPLQSQTQFIGEVVYHMFLAGNFYGWKWRAMNGDVLQIWPLRPDRVAPVYGGPNLIDHWEYRLGGKSINIPFEDVLHVPLGIHGTKTGIGMSPMETILRQADIDMDITEVVKVFLENHGVIPGIISVDSNIPGPDRERMEKQWAARRRKHGRTPFINGDVKFEKIALSLQELDTSALSNITDTAICRAFRIPPILVITRLGLERATYANYQQAHEAFWSDRVDPLCDLIADIVYRDILQEHDTGDIEPYFDKSKVQAYQAKILKEQENSRADFDRGLITVNEARAELGKPPVDGGDVRYIGFNVIPVGPDAPEYEPAPQKPEPDNQQDNDDEEDNEEEEIGKRRTPAIIKSRTARIEEFKRRANQRPRHADRLMPYLDRQWRAEFAKEKRETLKAIRQSKKALDEGELSKLLAELGYTWTQRASGILTPALTNAGKSGLDWSLNEIGIDKTPQGAEQILAQAIQQRTILSASSIPKTTLDKIRLQLSHGIAEGFSVDKIARNVSAMMTNDAPYRARAIAHTEVMNAYNAAAQAGYKSIGVTTKEWFVTEDDALCDFCQSMGGKTIGIDDVFVSGGDEVTVTVSEAETRLGISRDVGYPPLHPWCRCDIIPGTEEFFQ